MVTLSLSYLKRNWLGNIRNDVLAGMVVALALIPEAIAFSIIAGVDLKVSLYASFCIAIVIAFIGGRSGMISAATGAMALVMVLLVKEHGLEYLLAATILTGILQIIAGVFKLGSLMRFVSRSVVTGFVNALAILIFMAQLPEFKGAGIQMYGMVALGLAIIYIFPRFTKAVPSPLISIIIITAISIYFGMDLRTVGDMGELPSTLPIFLLPDIPLNIDTLRIVFPYALTLMAVGLLESLMTATIVDDLTDTPSNKNRECMGQGVANIVSGFFGGMAGCAMIGQSVINIKSGGRGRLSTLFAGLFPLFLLLVLGDWVRQIPMAALVAVMIMVSIGTFSWSSFKNLRTHPKTSSLVMITTVIVVVITHDLAMGVFVGVLTSALFFTRKVSRLLKIESYLSESAEKRTYKVYGQVFFASAGLFSDSFDFKEVVQQITIDVSEAHFWDLSAVGALDKVVMKFRREGTIVHLLGLNKASAIIVDRLAVHDKPNAVELMPNHYGRERMAKLLVCIDGSAYADNLCANAAWVAKQINAEIDLLHVMRRSSDYEAPTDHTGLMGFEARSNLLEELTKVDEERGRLDQEEGKIILEHGVKILQKAGVETINLIHRRGSLVETIQEFEDSAEMIFMGKRGEHANKGSIFLGSNLEKVARALHKPLFIVSSIIRPIKRFLIAYDGKASVRKAIDYIADQPLLGKGLECHLLVVERSKDEIETSEAIQKLEKVGFKTTLKVEQSPHVDQVIASYVVENEIDLLITGAYSHSRMHSLFLGSTTASLIKACKIPLLLFR